MLINSPVVAASTERLDRRYGERVSQRAAKKPETNELRERVKTYINLTRVPDDIGALERAVGTNDLLSLHYFWAGLKAARSVGRIVIAPVAGDPGGFATGFMISPHLMITNNHVLPTAEVVRRAKVQFSYEADAEGQERPPTWFSPDPTRFFVTSTDLDYTVVFVDANTRQGPEPLSSFGWLRLNNRLGKTDYGQYLSLIEHPGGQSKQVAIRENKLFPFDDTDDFLTYQSDTFRGSSGSPVFNDFWDVVALHHAGKPQKDENGNLIGHDGKPILDRKPQEHEIKWIANEGARVSRIVKDLIGQAPASEFKLALEEAIAGTRKPDLAAIEGELKVPAATQMTKPAPMPDLKAPDQGFIVALPLNVSLRVEALTQQVEKVQPKVPAAGVEVVAKPPAGDVTLERFNFDLDYETRRGYDESFLGRGRKVPMPKIASGSAGLIAPLKSGNGKVLHYHHFSIMMHKDRRIPALSAGNVNYSATTNERDDRTRADFGSEQWKIDERMEDRFQLPSGFYDRQRRLDFGHLVRREDNCWGATPLDIEFANADTYHLTNCTPQHEDFNQASKRGIWGQLEADIAKQAARDRAITRMCIFAGPVFGDHDLICDDSRIGEVRIPLAFWKVIVAPTLAGRLAAYGFILDQSEPLENDKPFEDFTPTKFAPQHKTLAEIEARTFIRFDATLKAIDAKRP